MTLENGIRPMPKIVAILQARCASMRLPNKVMTPILGQSILLHQLQRISHSKRLDQILIATTTLPSDNKLAHLLTTNNYAIFRGESANVLKRYFDASEFLRLQSEDIVVRITGDCPLITAEIIDECIEAFMSQSCQYLANCNEPIYPDGFDVEVFFAHCLGVANKNAQKDYQKEHVTPYIKEHCHAVALAQKPLCDHYRLTLDEEDDLTLIRTIYEHFNRTHFSLEEIIAYLEQNPKLLEINAHIKRNEGFKKD